MTVPVLRADHPPSALAAVVLVPPPDPIPACFDHPESESPVFTDRAWIPPNADDCYRHPH
ncbi:hypothetical protein ACWEKT_31915 [Nocardia takedensis]